MSTNGKIKVYKNSARNSSEPRQQYVPEYQMRGIDPEQYKSPVPPGSQIMVQSTNKVDPRSARPVIRQPYAEAVPSPIGRGRGPLPNVGNNLEQTWSSVDSEIIDDISNVDLDRPMVDNNDFVSEEALGFPQDSFIKDEPKSFLTENDLQDVLKDEYLTTVIKQLEEEEYLLLVDGATVCSGPLDYIQAETTKLVFGEHELYHKNPVSVDDILVIKRIKIKVGVFLV